MRPGIGWIDQIVGMLGHAVLADHRLGQALRVGDIIKSEAAFHAEPVFIGGAFAPGDRDQLVVLDLVSELAADAAIRADAVDLAVGIFGADVLLVDERRRHQRAGRAGLHAFAAGDASGVSHRVVEVEDDLFVMTAARHADHVIDLHFAAGADAEIAVDAGIEIDRHRHMAAVGRRLLLALGKAAGLDAHLVGPAPEFRNRDRARWRARADRRPGDRRSSCARSWRGHWRH